MQNQKSNRKHQISDYGSHDGKSKRWELTVDETNPYDLGTMLKTCMHPPKKRFPKQNPLPNISIGNWTTETLMIDFDASLRTTITDIIRYCKLLCKKYHLEGFIILKSSSKTKKIKNASGDRTVKKIETCGYHVVFNKPLTLKEINSILAWLCLELKDENLTKWFFMQLQKPTYTLRHGFKGDKRPPVIVWRHGKQNKKIKEFLENRNFVCNFLNGVTKLKRKVESESEIDKEKEKKNKKVRH
jgi:hypothetical protein